MTTPATTTTTASAGAPPPAAAAAVAPATETKTATWLSVDDLLLRQAAQNPAYQKGQQRYTMAQTTAAIHAREEQTASGSTSAAPKSCVENLRYRLTRLGWIVFAVTGVMFVYGLSLVVAGLQGALHGWDIWFGFVFGMAATYMLLPLAALPSDRAIEAKWKRSRYYFYELLGQLLFVFVLFHLIVSMIMVRYDVFSAGNPELLQGVSMSIALLVTVALTRLYGVEGEAYMLSAGLLILVIMRTSIPILGVGLFAILVISYVFFKALGYIAHEVGSHLVVGAACVLSFLFTFTQDYEEWLDAPTERYYLAGAMTCVLALLRAIWALFLNALITGPYSDTKGAVPETAKTTAGRIRVMDSQCMNLRSGYLPKRSRPAPASSSYYGIPRRVSQH